MSDKGPPLTYREYLDKLTAELIEKGFQYPRETDFSGMEYTLDGQLKKEEGRMKSVWNWLVANKEAVWSLVMCFIVLVVILLVVYNFLYCRITFGDMPITVIPSYCLSSFGGK